MAYSLHKTIDRLSGFIMTKNHYQMSAPSPDSVVADGHVSLKRLHRKLHKQLSSEMVKLLQQKPRPNFLSTTGQEAPLRTSSLGNLVVPTPPGGQQTSRSAQNSPVTGHSRICHQRSLSAEDVILSDGRIYVEAREEKVQNREVFNQSSCSANSEALHVIQCTECDQSSDLSFSNKDEGDSNSRIRHPSTQSLPESSMPQTRNVDGGEDDKVKDEADDDGDQDGNEIINTRLHRKKAVKLRRHPTEDASQLSETAVTTIKGHTRSLSYQDIPNLDMERRESSSNDDLDAVCHLEHGDSGIVINIGQNEGSPVDRSNLSDIRRRMCSIDSAPTEQSTTPPGHAYVYSEKQKMPMLSGLSPTNSEFSPNPKDNVFVLPEPGESSTDHVESIDPSELVISYRTGRDGGGPIIKKANTDTGHDRPYPFTRKHSMPAIYALRSVSQKVNLGNVECFQIHFDIIEELTKEIDIEVLPAIRGVTLREAVNSYLCKRGLTFEMVDFFIAASQSPLQVDTADCYFLAGADLHVRAKQTVNSPYTRSASTVSNRSGVKLGKNSKSEVNLPETVSPHGTLKGNQPLKGITKIFTGTKKSDQLNEILHSYSQKGWPSIPGLLQLGHKKFDPAIFRLEDNWTDLVKDTQNCDRYQQEAIWELLKTEVAYIRDLQLVINLFLACLYDLQSQEILNDIETEKIFSNIADLHQHNCLFYETHMYKIVTMARKTGQPLDPTPLIHGFTEFRSFFEAYSRFCIDYMSCQQYLIRMKEENELFKIFLSWAENQRECNRLSLRDYIGKPFQRLTKYKLLLERIWREPRPDHVQAMISKVDQFICQVNATVTQLEIMRRIDSYDAVDLPNNDHVAKMVGPFSRLDLTMPIPGTNRTRFLLEEGTLKMNSRTDVICFLFTDMLLITKATSKKVDVGSKVRVKVYKPPMRLDKVFLKQLSDGGFMLVYLNEYNLATTAYTFHGEQSRMWFERLRQAQADYEKLCNSIMDQSEAYLLNWANGTEYEDEFAYMNARSLAREMALDQATVQRQMSTSSADTSVFSDGIRSSEGRRPCSIPGSELDKLRIRSAVNLHGQNTATPLVNQYASNSAINSQHQQHHYPQQYYSYQDQHMDTSIGGSNPYLATRQGQQAKEYQVPAQYLSSSSEDTSQKLPSRIVAHDNMKKLKQRRDRRYYTADMIQDLYHGKDASIQKRLSWHSGAKDTEYEYKQRMVKKAAVSSDSLRSVYSSSGISSVGSLHANQDQEISEEGDVEWAEPSSEDSSSVASDITTKTKSGTMRTETTLSPEDSSSFPAVTRQDSDTQTPTNLSTQSKVSKSMPDISRLTLLEGAGGGNGQQRAALVDILRESHRRKLSDSHGKRLKLQLLNSTLEATDV